MKIACIVDSEFEDSELRVPMDRLTAAGLEVIPIGRKAGEEVAGKKGKERVRIARSIDDVRPDEFDALFIPGGYSPDKLRADPRFVKFTKDMDEQGKLVAAICHGPQLLLAAERVKGRTMTAWKTIQSDLRQAGAKVVDREVVRDGNLITSRQPSDEEAFSAEILSALGMGETIQPT